MMISHSLGSLIKGLFFIPRFPSISKVKKESLKINLMLGKEATTVNQLDIAEPRTQLTDF